jgi:hypothetical protein
MSGTVLIRWILALALISLSIFATVGCGAHPNTAAASSAGPLGQNQTL